MAQTTHTNPEIQVMELLDMYWWITRYSSPSILQPSVLRPAVIIRLLDLVPKDNFLCYMTFILRPPVI